MSTECESCGADINIRYIQTGGAVYPHKCAHCEVAELRRQVELKAEADVLVEQVVAWLEKIDARLSSIENDIQMLYED